MSVNWNWKRIGKVERFNKDYVQTTYLEEGINCPWVECQEWIDKDTKNEMYMFYNFYSDLDHVKRCLGLKKNGDGEFKNLEDCDLCITINKESLEKDKELNKIIHCYVDMSIKYGIKLDLKIVSGVEFEIKEN